MSFFVPTTGGWDTAIADPTNPRYWKVLIDIDDDDVLEDVTDDVSNNFVTGGEKKDYSGATWTVKLRNGQQTYAEGDFASAICQIQAQVSAEGYITVFTGWVSEEGCVRSKVNLTDDKITITMNDEVKQKGTRRKTDRAIWQGFKICDPANVSTSIFHRLALTMGLAAGDLDVVEIDYTKDNVFLNGNTTAWKELQNLAAQYLGRPLAFRYDGKLRHSSRFETGWGEPTSEWTLEEDVNIHSWKAQNRPIVCTRAITKFDQYQQVGDAGRVIYKNTENWSQILKETSIDVLAGEYWPGPNVGDKAQLHYVDPDSGEKFPLGTSIITPTLGATGSGSDIESDNGVLTLTSFNGSTSATQVNANSSEIILQNATGSTVTITKLEIRGTSYQLDTQFEVQDIDNSVADEDHRDLKIDGRYAVDVDQAHVTTEWWSNEWGNAVRKQFELVIDWLPQFQKGAAVTVLIPSASINMTALIESYTHLEPKGPMSRAKTSVIVIEKDSFSPTTTPLVVAEASGDASTVAAETTAEEIADRPTYNEAITSGWNTGDGTTTPSQAVITLCKPVFRGVVLEADIQADLTNFSHYEWQVSDDDATWYSLQQDGTDWKGVLTAKTTARSPFLVHANIPLGGTASAPTGPTLYYRCRRVTKAPTSGTYSASSTATVLTVQGGDLGANSVYANNVIATEVVALLLRAATLWIGYAGTGTYDSPAEGDRRIYADDDELLFQVYTDGAWSTERQLAFGGVDSNGNFRPFLGCRGILGDIDDSPLLDPIPSRTHRLFKFDNNAEDQHGVDPWTVVVGAFVYDAGVKWEGTHSLAPSATILTAWYAGGWAIGNGVTGAMMFRIDDSEVMGHDLLEWGASSDDDRINLSYGSNGKIKLEVEKSTTVSSVTSTVTVNDAAWHFIGCTYDADTNTAYLRIDDNEYSFTPGGSWGSGTKNTYLTLIGGASYDRYIDDLLFSSDTAMDPDLFFQHVQRDVAWTADYFANDLLLKPKSGGEVVVDSQLAISGASRIEAYSTGATTTVGAIWKVLDLAGKTYDNLGEFNVSNSTFTAQKPGYYYVRVQLLWASATWAAGNIYAVRLYVNSGVTLYNLDYQVMETTAGTRNNWNAGERVIYLATGDTVEVQIYSTLGRSTYAASNTYTYLTIHRLS